MISDLMLFARPPKLGLATCDLRALTGKVVDVQQTLAIEYGAELTFHADGEVWAQADETQLAVAIGALVKNALEAVSEGGRVHVLAEIRQVEGSEWARIAVKDDGPGISDEIRRHMFDPFYSGREAGRGLGFGASKCWRIVKDHGGRVVVSNCIGGGAEVAIELPVN